MVDMFGFHSTGVWLLNECACSRQLEKTRKCIACEHSRLPSHPVAAIFNATKTIDESHSADRACLRRRLSKSLNLLYRAWFRQVLGPATT